MKDTKVNTSAFYNEEGEAKSLYFGLVSAHDIGAQQYVDVLKRGTTYVPEKGHFVVGIIKNRVGENFIVDVNAPVDGTLGNL